MQRKPGSLVTIIITFEDSNRDIARFEHHSTFFQIVDGSVRLSNLTGENYLRYNPIFLDAEFWIDSRTVCLNWVRA